MIASVDYLLLEAEYDRAEIFIVGEIVPVLRAVEVALVSFLFNRSQFKRSRPVELLLNGRFATRLQFVDLRQTRRTDLQHSFVFFFL